MSKKNESLEAVPLAPKGSVFRRGGMRQIKGNPIPRFKFEISQNFPGTNMKLCQKG